jgi:hypothetical protein
MPAWGMQVKYELADWEKRKSTLLPLLDAAAGEGLIAREQAGRLGDFLLGRGVMVGNAIAPVSPVMAGEGLDTPIAAETSTANEDSEAPRFIRGFHDILITIGIIVVLVGLGGLASILAVIPATIVLAEILVRRQRLALPAVVLTIAFGMACVSGLLAVLGDSLPKDWEPVIILALVSVVAFLFYWRYKAPIALASGFLAGYGAVVLGVAMLVIVYGKNEKFFLDHPGMFAAFLGAFAALVFVTALAFDLRDRERLTRRSDVAFWMHLAAAPAILYTMLAFIFLKVGDTWFAEGTTLLQAGEVVLVVAVLMLMGVILDRRAFVTSGLLSFGYAFKIILTQGGIEKLFSSTSTLAFIILLAVGIVVLTIGVGWQPFRRFVVGVLPGPMRAAVPPVRG